MASAYTVSYVIKDRFLRPYWSDDPKSIADNSQLFERITEYSMQIPCNL